MVLSYYYLALVRKWLLQAHHEGCCNLFKSLLFANIFAISTYLTTINQYLTILFFQNYASLEKSPLDENMKPLKK